MLKGFLKYFYLKKIEFILKRERSKTSVFNLAVEKEVFVPPSIHALQQ